MTVTPFSLKDAPSLIEKVFPTTRISAETQKERKAGSGQTLTGLGSYWKGRKPLILTRALVLASLMPASDDLGRDVEIFEMLMGMDRQGLSRRLPAGKQSLLRSASYTEIVSVAKRPEEISESVLLDGVWKAVNAHLGTTSTSIDELVEQLGIMRYGRRPKLADTFSGSGSIPFEAARMGCDVYASDLNPVACMLTWGAFNIVGAAPEDHARMKAEQVAAVSRIDEEIRSLGIEHDATGNRTKSHLYCIETRCPRTGYMVPMAPSWVISKKRNVIARLVPDHENKRYDIEILTGVTEAEMAAAAEGSVRKGRLHHEVLDDDLGIAIKDIRYDYKDEAGVNRNRLRMWEKSDFQPRPDDIWQERLYAVHWMDGAEIASGKAYPRTWFAAPDAEDFAREEFVREYVGRHLAEWQVAGIVPDMEIEYGKKTEELIRTRGWTHWHHLFNARHLLINAVAGKHARGAAHLCLGLAKVICHSARTTTWNEGKEQADTTFTNNYLNTMMNYPARGWVSCAGLLGTVGMGGRVDHCASASPRPTEIPCDQDLIITDPPYADAVQYDEISEFFIAWLRKNPPAPFDGWIWDSRRNLAIKGEGQSFKMAMVEAYRAMTGRMSENGLQIVQFTHQDSKTWSDMAQIFWGAGLQVVQDWYVSTEMMNGLKVGGYVQGTHMIVLKKRQGDRSGYDDEIMYEIQVEVERQIKEMVGLNEKLDSKKSPNIFLDADLQMAGYAAALRILTSYTHINGLDMTREAMRPRKKGVKTVVDEMTEFAVRTANEYLVPKGISPETWGMLNGVERFFLKMTDMEARGRITLDDYQNFSKAFRVEDYAVLMGSVASSTARLKTPAQLANRSLGGDQEFGSNVLVRQLLHACWKVEKQADTDVVLAALREAVPDYVRKHRMIGELVAWLADRWSDAAGKHPAAVRVLAEALRVENI